MILQVFFCISSITGILSQSPQTGSYNEGGHRQESSGRRIEEYSGFSDEHSKFFNPESTDDSIKNEERQSARRGIVDPEVTDQLEGNGWLDVIPGTPGKDYPNYKKIPETSFSCNGKTPGGYYADIETRCQIFHVCNADGQKSSFVCPSGSIFNQKYFVCDWWYDFECDDATDLYSLNEKINRGGTGSGPSGPGRIEENYEYFLQNENIPEDISELKNGGNFVYTDGSDLSFAGTGEGGPGYARNKNNRGYQGNVDEEDYRRNEKSENQGQERRRKIIHGKKTAEEISKLDSSKLSDDKKGDKNEGRLKSGDGSPRGFSSSSIRDSGKESKILSDAREGERDLLKQNSANGNHGGNYQGSGNSNVPIKTDNFRTGNDGNYNRGEQPNRFNDNNHNNQKEYSSATASGKLNDNNNNNNNNYNEARRNAENFENPYGNHNRNDNRRNFGQRSWKNSPARIREDNQTFKTGENKYNQGSSSSLNPSSGSNNEEYSNLDGVKGEKKGGERENGDEETENDRRFYFDRNSAAPYSSPVFNNNEHRIPFGHRGANIRGRQRTNGGLPRGLGNGNLSSGRVRELTGSDVIAAGGGITPPPAGGETVYDREDQGSLNSQQKTFYSARRSSSRVDFDDEKIASDHQSQRLQRSDFRDDNSSQGIENNNNNAYNKGHPIPNPNSSTRNENAFDSNYREGNRRDGSNIHRQNSEKNSGNDYLVGIVPATDHDRDDGNSNNGSQNRRFLPIL